MTRAKAQSRGEEKNCYNHETHEINENIASRKKEEYFTQRRMNSVQGTRFWVLGRKEYLCEYSESPSAKILF